MGSDDVEWYKVLHGRSGDDIKTVESSRSIVSIVAENIDLIKEAVEFQKSRTKIKEDIEKALSEVVEIEIVEDPTQEQFIELQQNIKNTLLALESALKSI